MPFLNHFADAIFYWQRKTIPNKKKQKNRKRQSESKRTICNRLFCCRVSKCFSIWIEIKKKNDWKRNCVLQINHIINNTLTAYISLPLFSSPTVDFNICKIFSNHIKLRSKYFVFIPFFVGLFCCWLCKKWSQIKKLLIMFGNEPRHVHISFTLNGKKSEIILIIFRQQKNKNENVSIFIILWKSRIKKNWNKYIFFGYWLPNINSFSIHCSWMGSEHFTFCVCDAIFIVRQW